jgi:acyl-CoA synthetase
MPAFDAVTVAAYHADGSWDDDTIADLVARQARRRPDAVAFHAPDATLTWGAYEELSTRLAGAFAAAGLGVGEKLAVLLTGGALVHVVYLAAQKAGLVTVGLAPRAGDREISHLLERTGATALLNRSVHRGRRAGEVAAGLARCRLVADLDGSALSLSVDGTTVSLPGVAAAWDLVAGRALGADDVFFINATSGTTGLPRCVEQTMNARKYFAPLAASAAGFRADEVFASLVPAPYGFGLWSAHIVPARYGYPTVLVDEFEAAAALRLVEQHRVTVVAAVTSQFVMMLNAPQMAERDLSSLRTLFTGGEKVPAARAAEFEQRTGAAVLQFYGSNEAGPVSVTRRDDDRDHRLTTAGRVIPAQRVRLIAADGADVTTSGGPGQCAVRGPGITPGYHHDAAANAALVRPDGWMLLGDMVTVDADGYLRVVGRTADFLIRGGHNISAVAVEEAVGSHPRVVQVAVVGVADPVLGERACAFVVTSDGADLGLADLRAYLATCGVSKQYWPERLVTLDALPLGPGSKVDKPALRADAAHRFTAPAPDATG